MRFDGKVAVVTGGASGIGRAVALALTSEGANVSIWDVDHDEAMKVVKKIRAGGGDAMAHKVDVALNSEIQNATRRVLSTWGRIDVLVNSAGICPVCNIENISESEWESVLSINLKGTFLCSRAVMGVMKKQKSGKIINFGSVAGKVGGIAVGAHYSASKAGVMCFTKSLARELAPYGVNVNGIAPGVIETDMTRNITGGNWENYLATIPMGRIGKVEDVAKVAIFLASDDASYLTGEIIDVNGGQYMD